MPTGPRPARPVPVRGRGRPRPLLSPLAAAAGDLGLAPPEAVRWRSASDANLAAALGVPTLDGLGAVGAHPHARSEHVDLHGMHERAALLAALIARITHLCPETL